MDYIKKLLKSSLIIIITSSLPIIITILSALIYTLLGYNNQEIFINNYLVYIIIIYYLITTIYLIKKYKVTIKPLSITNYYNFISIGVSLSIILNMLIFKITIPNPEYTVPLPILILSSSIIGPIYEEILFRYIYLQKLKKFNTPTIAIIINTLVFALIHINPIKIFYALILGLILNISYHQKKNILIPIIIHISTNLIALFLTNYNFSLLILSLILLVINIKIYKKSC